MNPVFLENVQGIIGGGINASRITHCPAKVTSGLNLDVFNLLIFKDDGVTIYSPEYLPFYPEGLQHRNKGGLHLVPPNFMPWAIDLMKFIDECYTDEKIILNRCEFIAISLDRLRKDDAHYNAFSRKVRESVGIADPLLRKIHLRIAEFAFRTYTKEKNDETFNGVKKMASDVTNVTFRTQVQTGCIGQNEESITEK